MTGGVKGATGESTLDGVGESRDAGVFPNESPLQQVGAFIGRVGGVELPRGDQAAIRGEA